MTDITRETQLVDLFTSLADSLVADYDVIELLQTLVDTSVDLFEMTAAGILLVDANGQLDVVVSTSEESRLVEVMQLDAEEGPCLESFTTGEVVSVADVGADVARWPRFAESAAQQGFRAVHAIPLRVRERTIGALNLLRATPGEISERDARAARALADVATIGIVHERLIAESGVVQAQLQRALTSRVIIEQAKGVVAHVRSISTDEAFALIRGRARASRTSLSVLAEQIVNREVVL
jgi:GAF domain-containing protein